MPFPTILDGGQITQVRATTQDFEHYLLANPNDIIWQAEVDEVKIGAVYAQFNWTNTLQGARTDTRIGHLMLITSAADDFSNPIIRGRIRKAPDATDIFCNEVSVDIDKTMFITVIDDFDIMERLIKVTAGGAQKKDWDLDWSDLPPVISGLQSVYADFSESDPVPFSFSPSAIAPADGASISTWAWDIEDGSFTGGTSDSDQNIQVTFPVYTTNEHRWVHLIVTDDNGNATTFHFEVYTVSKNSSTAVKLDVDQTQISGSLGVGWDASIVAASGFSKATIWDMNRVAIASIDNYGGTATPIVSNIMMVGRLRTENSPTIADEVDGLVAETQLQIEGFGSQLARIPSPRLPIFDEDSPDSWGDITDPTLTRTTAYVWFFHSTLLNLCSLTFNDFSAFISDEFKIEDSSLLDSINGEALSVNAQIAFAPAGEMTIRRNANYLSSADRDGLDTIFDFQIQDMTRYQLDIEYGQPIGQVIVGALVYSTSANEISQAWIGRAPPVTFGTGHETAELNGQVITADASEDDSRDEVGQRTANHLAFINPKPRIQATLIDGFWWLIPTVHQWYTFTLAAETNARGRAYTTDDRWLCIDVTYAPVWDDSEKAWVRATTANFELETTSTNAAIDVSIVPPVNDNLLAPPPNSGYMDFPEDPLIDFATDDPPNFLGLGVESFVTEPAPQNQNSDSPIGGEVLNVPMNANAPISTTRDTEIGETYVIRVEGDGVVFDEAWSHLFEFRAESGSAPNTTYGQGGWNVGGSGEGKYTSGVGFEDTDEPSGGSRQRGVNHIFKAFTASDINYVRIGFDYVKGQNDIPANTAFAISGNVLPNQAVDFTDPNVNTGTGKAYSTNVSAVGETQINCTIVSDSVNASPYTFTGNVIINTITISGTGAAPPEFDTSAGVRGDAFYRGYDTDEGASLYDASNGLQIDSARPGTLGPYSGAHSYTFTATGTGSPFEFKFIDSDYTDNDNNILRVIVTGPNMGVTSD